VSGAVPVVSLVDLEDDPGEISLLVHGNGVSGMRAFGFEVSYPASLEFLGVDRGALTERFVAVEAGVVSQGRLRAGGYSHDAVEEDEGELVVLRFRRLGAPASGSVVVEEFVDDLEGAETVRFTLPSGGGDTPWVSSYRLHQNHPNPFNPTTTIRYEIPSGAGSVAVSLAVYDVEGRRVRVLVDQSRTGGVQYVEWDGRDDEGRAVSSGIYFYVLRAGNETLTKKMALVK